MKKLLILAAVGVLGTLALLKTLHQKQEVYHFVDSDTNEKNFGAFPPDIPEDQFDEMFV
jgi:hypothetical protein